MNRNKPALAFLAARGVEPAAAAILGGCFAAGLVLIVFLGPGAAIPRGLAASVQPGVVAEVDIIAEREVTYVDEKATALRYEAEERLVLPVFVVDDQAGARAVERFRAYQDLFLSLTSRPFAPDSLYYTLQSEYPGILAKKDVARLAAFALRSQAFANADAVLRRVLENGVAAMPASGLERYNPDYVDLVRDVGGRREEEEVPSQRLATTRSVGAAIEEEVAGRRLSRPLDELAILLAKAFVVENAFFDESLSGARLEAVRLEVAPVYRTIARGEHIVRKGLVVTDADYQRLKAALASSGRADWGKIAGEAGIYVLFTIFALGLLGREVSGVRLDRRALGMAAGSALACFAAVLALARLAHLADPIWLGLFLPAALATLLLAILAGQRFALLYGVALSLFVLLGSGFDVRPFVLVLLSGTAGAFAVRRASSRIDLVRAGAFLALAEGAIAAVMASPEAGNAFEVLIPAAAGSVNGFLCGVLSLALLPIIEQAMNAPTRFRLMELSDLNAPVLKRLLTVAPGTYSHSITVAHLAESACREIGADPLLARVGAYYHDIGKIEQPEYFVENQSGLNKHDTMNPRLSVTVIRSHVKLGVEKARALGLPEEVAAIVGEHHGNGLIAYFYHQALKDDPDAKVEDYSYPGSVPSSREAAVVMLADTVEAATRTLKKPTLTRLEDFIKELVMEKVKQGQLDRSELTFKDLETIRASFARILAGHFHSRIEYPRMKEQQR